MGRSQLGARAFDADGAGGRRVGGRREACLYRRDIGQHRGVRRQFPRRHHPGGRGDQCRGRHPQGEDRAQPARHPDQSRRRAFADAEGDRRRSLCDPGADLLRQRQGRPCTMLQQAEIPHSDRRRGRRADRAGRSLPVPHLVRPADRHAEDRELHPRRAQGQDGRADLGQQRFRQGRPRQPDQGDWPRATSSSSPTSRPSPARSISPPTWSKLKAANADAVFVYSNEEECARIMREARKQGLKGPFVGDTTLLSQKTIELAGDAANGVQGHVGLTADAPIPAVTEFTREVSEALQLQAGSQRHQGLHRRLRGQVRHREEARQIRSQGASPRRCTG